MSSGGERMGFGGGIFENGGGYGGGCGGGGGGYYPPTYHGKGKGQVIGMGPSSQRLGTNPFANAQQQLDQQNSTLGQGGNLRPQFNIGCNPTGNGGGGYCPYGKEGKGNGKGNGKGKE